MTNTKQKHGMKSVRIRSFSGPYFEYHISPFSVRMRENTDRKNSEYGHYLCCEVLLYKF